MKFNFDHFKQEFEKVFGYSWESYTKLRRDWENFNWWDDNMTRQECPFQDEWTQKHKSLLGYYVGVYGMSWLQPDSSKESPGYANIQHSNMTCGVTEIGNTAVVPAHLRKELITRIVAYLLAYTNRGQVNYYNSPSNSNWDAMTNILKPYGFVDVQQFYNPNSGHTVHQFTVHLPKRSEIGIS